MRTNNNIEAAFDLLFEKYEAERTKNTILKTKFKGVLDKIKQLITDNDNYFTDDILNIIREAKNE